MGPPREAPSAPAPTPKLSLYATWPYSVQLAVAVLLAMGVGFLLSRSMAGDPVRREPPTAETREATRGPQLDLNRATRAEFALLPGVGPTRAQSIDDYRAQHGDFETVDDLRKVPGIGPKLSQRIIDERTLRGPFKTVDELRRVPGIGPKTLQRLRPHVAVEQAAEMAGS